MGKMQKEKGKRGELEVVHILRKHGIKAQRGQQHKGTSDSPDVIHDIPFVHLEVKFRENFAINATLDKAREECGTDVIPVICHRRVYDTWRVTMTLEDFLDYIEEE